MQESIDGGCCQCFGHQLVERGPLHNQADAHRALLVGGIHQGPRRHPADGQQTDIVDEDQSNAQDPLWMARKTGALLTVVDIAPVAVAPATERRRLQLGQSLRISDRHRCSHRPA
jgi:hypothetical protein